MTGDTNPQAVYNGLGRACVGLFPRTEDVSTDLVAIEKEAERPTGTPGGAT